MKASVVVIDPAMAQVKLEKLADLNKLAKKYGREIIDGPAWKFFIFDSALYFVEPK